MPSKEFSQEELDRMYDEAMAWQPGQPMPGQKSPRSPLLQAIMDRAKEGNDLNTTQS